MSVENDIVCRHDITISQKLPSNPKSSMMASIASHRTISNAFLKSKVMHARLDVLLELNPVINSCARFMQSLIHLPQMNAIWLLDIRLGSTLISQFDRILDITFYASPTQDMGLYSSSIIGAGIFGIRTRNV